MSAVSIQFDPSVFHLVPTRKYRPLEGLRDVLAKDHCIHGPNEIHITAAVQTVGPTDEITVTVCCTKPPHILHRETVIAQDFLLPLDIDSIPEHPVAFWVEIMGQDKPLIDCSQLNKGNIYLQGMVDTGADIIMITQPKWSPNQELTPVTGVISVIGGAIVSMRSKHTITIEGPESQTATIRPFVVRAPITLWARDLLSQWGA